MSLDDGLPDPRRLFAFLAVATAVTMVVLDTSIVNVALPAIAEDLSIDPADAIWTVNVYQIAIAISLLPLSTLGESYGYRRIYCIGLTLFTLASLICASVPSFSFLIVARILQGVGAAGVVSVNLALVRFIYPSGLLTKGLARNTVVVGIASAAGPTVAAAILSVATWPWLFLANVPLGLVALLISIRTLPKTPLVDRSFDWTGAALNALTLVLLISAMASVTYSDSSLVPFMLACGGVLVGTGFVRHQTTHPTPLLPLDLLRIPVFTLSMITSICSFSAQTVAYISLPFYFHDVLGRSIVETGLLMTSFPLALAVVAPASGHLADRYPPEILSSIGLAILAAGLGVSAILPSGPTSMDIAWRLALCGIGFGLFQSPNNKVILTSAPRDRSGGAGGMLAMARLIGQLVGAGLAMALFGLMQHDATSAILWVGAALSAVGCAASTWRAWRGSNMEKHT